VSPRTISSIERAENEGYDSTIKDAIEIAMRWQVGSVDRVSNEQELIPEPGIEPEVEPLMKRIRELWPMLTAEAKAAVVRIVELLARR
jgi:hypothetical protein